MVYIKKLATSTLLVLVIILTSIFIRADTGDPQVHIIHPNDGTIIKGKVKIRAEAIGFMDLTASFAHFSYSPDGIHFTFLEPDQDSSDGFAQTWDTAQVVDGKYSIKVSVTGTFGDKASRQISVIVNNHVSQAKEGIHSLTRELAENIGSGMEKAWSILEFSDEDEEIFAFLRTTSGKFKEAAGCFRDVERSLVNIKADLPAVFSKIKQVKSSDSMSEIFGNLASSFESAGESIKTMDNGSLKAALKEIQTEISSLVGLNFCGIDFTPLTKVKDKLDKILMLTDKVDQLVKGTEVDVEGSEIDELIRQFKSTFAKIGEIIEKVGTQVKRLASNGKVKFTNSSGNDLNSYSLGEELILRAPKVKQMKFELFDVGQSLVFSKTAEKDEIGWQGTGSDGKLLPAGLYYFQVTLISEEQKGVEIGWIVIS